MADYLKALEALEARHDGPIPARELAALPPSHQEIERAKRNEADAASSYWMKLAWIKSCAVIAQGDMHGNKPLEESLSEIQHGLDEARQAARRLDEARERHLRLAPDHLYAAE